MGFPLPDDLVVKGLSNGSRAHWAVQISVTEEEPTPQAARAVLQVVLEQGQYLDPVDDGSILSSLPRSTWVSVASWPAVSADTGIALHAIQCLHAIALLFKPGTWQGVAACNAANAAQNSLRTQRRVQAVIPCHDGPIG